MRRKRAETRVTAVSVNPPCQDYMDSHVTQQNLEVANLSRTLPRTPAVLNPP